MTTETIEVAELSLAGEQEHLAGVDTAKESEISNLAGDEDELRDLSYSVSRGEGDTDETGLKVIRERVSERRDRIRKLELVQSKSTVEVDRKKQAVKIAEQAAAAAEYEEYRDERQRDAKVVEGFVEQSVKAIYKLDANDYKGHDLAVRAGLTDTQANRAQSRTHVAKWLAAQFEVFLGQMVDRPHRVFRETPLSEIEADMTRTIKQDIDRAGRRLTNSNGATSPIKETKDA